MAVFSSIVGKEITACFGGFCFRKMTNMVEAEEHMILLTPSIGCIAHDCKEVDPVWITLSHLL